MNSIDLQKKFPDTYKSFFGKNNLVVSGCFSFAWGPRAIGYISNKLILKSNIPLRCYVGMQKRDDNQIVLGNISMYSSTFDQFDNYPIENVIKDFELLQSPIRTFLSDCGMKGGFDISFLAEIGKGHSLGFTGTLPAALSLALHIAGKKLSIEEIDVSFEEIDHNKQKEIIRLAWELELIIRKGKTFGQTIYHTLYGDHIPSLYISKTDLLSVEPGQIDQIETHFWKYSDADDNLNFDFPFEYLIIFSGAPSEVQKLEHSKKTDIELLDDLENFLQTKILQDTPIQGLYFEKLLQAKKPYEVLSDALGVLNIDTIRKFHELFQDGYTESKIDNFLQHLDNLRKVLSVTDKQSDFADRFIHHFNNYKTQPEEKIGIFPIYSGKVGGGFLISVKSWISRDTLEKTITRMKEYYPRMGQDYSSITDFSKDTKIHVEQDIISGRYSSFLPKGQVRFIGMDGEIRVGEYTNIIENNKHIILFDTIAQKIHFFGEKLTSEHIPSQTTVVDVINTLFDRLGEDVENTNFPASSYVKNRNDMFGKIILPIVKLIEKKTGETLPFTCFGGMTSFNIRLERTSVPIGIIRKL